MVETATTNPEVAVRVTVAIDRGVKWHAKKLEESETRRKEPERKTGEEAVASSDPQVGVEEERLPIGKRKSDHRGDEGRAPDQEGGSSSSQTAGPEPGTASPGVSSDPKVKTTFGEKKRSTQDSAESRKAPLAGHQREDYILPTYGNVTLRQAEKRPAEENLQGEDPCGTKQQRKLVQRKSEKRETTEEPQTNHPHDGKYEKIDGEGGIPDMSLIEALEDDEERTLHMASAEYHMPLITCEEPVDISYLKADCAVDLSDAIACANVGEIRHVLDRRLSPCMMAELCEEDSPARALSRGGSSEAELGAWISDYGSPMGIIPDESEDRWEERAP